MIKADFSLGYTLCTISDGVFEFGQCISQSKTGFDKIIGIQNKLNQGYK